MLTVKFWEYLQECINKQEVDPFRHNFSILSYSRDYKVGNYIIVIKKDKGVISHSELQRELEVGKRIAMKNILREVEGTKFYDVKPHVVYTMEVLWDFVFPKEVPEEDYRKYPMNKPLLITVNTDDILEKVRKHFAPKSNPHVIKRPWIKEALDKFDDLGIARKLDNDGNQFEVNFRKRGGRKRTRSFILDMFFSKNGKEFEIQMTLDKFSKTKSNP